MYVCSSELGNVHVLRVSIQNLSRKMASLYNELCIGVSWRVWALYHKDREPEPPVDIDLF